MWNNPGGLLKQLKLKTSNIKLLGKNAGKKGREIVKKLRML